ncbi:MAG: hypothetical protein J0H12_03940 [Candidatus Paracaedimonas acanthamoebae]|jgi:tetratricopeptide (TPR) repeat protein|uniref:NB-ARC domain-containing protein n=1 Tax=Candidatus Paracaedimonas acanthamoebae TaxID=244581 RepID=A0A8J7TVI8_9PROT|nr:hypothetical protein [Candidatus Paracaedimonas acanthamoebae]
MLNKTLLSRFLILVSIHLTAHSQPPKIWNVPLKNENFIGRTQELEKIQQQLMNSSMGRYFVITGIAGIGKTQLAKEYAHKNYNNYDIVWWFDASKDISSQIVKFCEQWNNVSPVSERIQIKQISLNTLIEVAKNKLRTIDQSWLLIFDNASDIKVIEKYIPEKHSQKLNHILITSKNSATWNNQLLLKNFTRAESLEYIKRILDDQDIKNAEDLAETLKDYPLALAQAVAYLKTHPSSNIENYKKIINEGIVQEARDKTIYEGNFMDNYSETASRTLKISFNEIKKNNPEAHALLIFMSYLDSKNISANIIKKWIHYAKIVSDYNFLIATLLKHSLIEIHKPEKTIKGDNTSYNIHEIVQNEIQREATQDQAKQIINHGIEAFLDLLNQETDVMVQSLLENRETLYHLEKIATHANAIGIKTPSLLTLRVLLLECYLSGLRDLDLAEKSVKEISALNKDVNFSSEFMHALYLINLGNYYAWKISDIHLSIKNMGEALSILLKLDGQNNEKLRTITNLAQFYTVFGNVKTAKEYAQQGEKFYEAANSKIYKSLFRFAKSLILTDEGDLQQAYEESITAEQLIKTIEEYPVLKFALYIQQSEILLKQRKVTDGLKVAEKAYHQCQEFFQTDDHAMPARSRVMLAALKSLKGQLDEAILILKQCIETYNKAYKGESKHTNQAFAHKVLGDIYFKKGELEKAYDEYLRTEKIYDNVCLVKGLDDVSDLYMKLSLLGLSIKDKFLAQKYLQKHTQEFGATHHRTLEIIKNFDVHKVPLSAI